MSVRTYIATGKSKQVIKDARKAEKKGEPVDWGAVLNESDRLKAKNIGEQIKAIAEVKK